MLSGSRARGSSSAPGSGKTGITSGRSGRENLRVISNCRRVRPVPWRSGEDQGRQAPAALLRDLALRAETVEYLEELRPCRAIVPFAIATEELDEGIDRARLVPTRDEGHGQVVTRLVIVRVALDAGAEIAGVAGARGLVGKRDLGVHRGDGRI